MPSTSFDESVKEYYERKSDYLTLIEAAEKEDITTEGSQKSTKGQEDDHSEAARNSETKESSLHKESANLPNVRRPEGSVDMNPKRAFELIAEMRSSIEKGSNKETKELLSKLDRGMGFPPSTRSR